MSLRLPLVLFLLVSMCGITIAQNTSSPAVWMYPNGNLEATHAQFQPSRSQPLDSLKLKWSTTALSGDIQPLIGNIKNNPKLLPEYLWSPNEIVAVVKDKIVVIDGTGQVLTETPLPSFVKYVKGISVLFDSSAILPTVGVPVQPLVMALETIESEDTVERRAYSYLAGYDKVKDSVIIFRRLSVDLSDFDSNYVAGVRPFAGRAANGQTIVYATVNIHNPRILPSFSGAAPYFRGLTQFDLGIPGVIFPLPDTRDQVASRITLGPEISLYQPSVGLITNSANDAMTVAPSVFPTPSFQELISNSVTQSTFSDFPYLMTFPMIATTGNSYVQGIPPVDLAVSLTSDGTRSRPLIRPYFIPLNDAGNSNAGAWYILMAEEYTGRDSSRGGSRLHLFNTSGQPLTVPDDPNVPSYIGGNNHFWSVGIGDMDGDVLNEALPYYPNNPGQEIVVTQSSRESAYAGNKISVLRWRNGNRIEKINRPGTFLFPFDTVCTQRINGWVAAVNDFDGGTDKRSEVFVVDRSTVRIMRMRTYNDSRFRFGAPFDTLFTINLPNETITSLAVADLEGDGRNDIIITTLNKTYCYGSLLPGSIRLTTPKIQQTPPQEFCLGDTLTIRWTNLLRGQDFINIFFQNYSETGTWIRKKDTLFRNVPNNSSSDSVSLLMDAALLGKQGRIIIQSANSPDITDSSSYIRLAKPEVIILTPPQDSTIIAGIPFTFTGLASCVDSLWLEFESDSLWAVPDSAGKRTTSWIRLTSQQLSGIQYAFNWGTPLTGMFSCTGTDLDSVLRYRVVGKDTTFGISDTSEIHSLRIVPHPLAITIDPPPAKACAERKITWNPIAVPSSLGCNEFTFAYSVDKGKTFIELDRVPTDAGEYDWHLPTNAKDSTAIVRICCAAANVRIDTTLNNIVVKYIKLVAPNPFAPPTEIMEVIYSVPEETTVNVRVYDQANRIVAEPVSNERRLPNIAYCDKWDGNTPRGTAVNGIYYISVELANGTREVYRVFVKKK